MSFDSALFLFVAGLIVGGAVVYLLYTRIAVVAAELKAKVDAFENAFGTLKADVSGAGSAVTTALKAAATPVLAAPASAAPAAPVAAPAPAVPGVTTSGAAA